MKAKAAARQVRWLQDRCDIYGRVLLRDDYTCQLCGTRCNLEIHHVRFRSSGGKDSQENLITLCHGCHCDLHSGRIELSPLTATGGA